MLANPVTEETPDIPQLRILCSKTEDKMAATSFVRLLMHLQDRAWVARTDKHSS